MIDTSEIVITDPERIYAAALRLIEYIMSIPMLETPEKSEETQSAVTLIDPIERAESE